MITSKDIETNDQYSDFKNFIKKLATGEVEFAYLKKNREIRYATGTINYEIIKKSVSAEQLLKLENIFNENGTVNLEEILDPDNERFFYFDLEKNGLRQFYIDNLLEREGN